MVGNTARRPHGQAALFGFEHCRERDGVAADQQHDFRLRLPVVAAGQPLGGAGLTLTSPSCLARASCSSRIREFLGMIRAGAGPNRSGFLGSGFFTLVGNPRHHMSASA